MLKVEAEKALARSYAKTAAEKGALPLSHCVALAIRDLNPVAVSLENGCIATMENNRFREHRIPQGKIVKESRRKLDGRCTLLLVEYLDKSRLKFTWSEIAGPRYSVVKD